LQSSDQNAQKRQNDQLISVHAIIWYSCCIDNSTLNQRNMKYIFCILAFCSLLACNNTTNKTPAKTAGEPIIQSGDARYCYLGNSGKDTVQLNFTKNGSTVTGRLSYLFYEKDKNLGAINGEMKGDTLIADYTFQSEGHESIRQVAFVRRDSSLIEGHGDMVEKEGKMQFSNPGSLTFDGGFKLSKTDCP
jgi:hypothetical protein